MAVTNAGENAIDTRIRTVDGDTEVVAQIIEEWAAATRAQTVLPWNSRTYNWNVIVIHIYGANHLEVGLACRPLQLNTTMVDRVDRRGNRDSITVQKKPSR